MRYKYVTKEYEMIDNTSGSPDKKKLSVTAPEGYHKTVNDYFLESLTTKLNRMEEAQENRILRKYEPADVVDWTRTEDCLPTCCLNFYIVAIYAGSRSNAL